VAFNTRSRITRMPVDVGPYSSNRPHVAKIAEIGVTLVDSRLMS